MQQKKRETDYTAKKSELERQTLEDSALSGLPHVPSDPIGERERERERFSRSCSATIINTDSFRIDNKTTYS